MGSPARYQPTSFTNHGGTNGVQAGVSIVNGDIIMQQPHAPLSHLPNASDAPIYSSAIQREPLCLAETRVKILHEIDNWADGQDDCCIFWLSGLAGTGKSTIARTVAQKYYKERKRLAASFFFSRGGGEDVRCAKKFVTSLAMQLTHNVESSRQLIHEAVIERNDIADHSLREQWYHLILVPLSKLNDCNCPTPLILVVDALDECEDEDDICIIVQLLAEIRSLTKVRLRVLLTSRPEAPIRSEFNRLQQKHQAVLHQVVLHDMPRWAINQDIDLFLKHEFERYCHKEKIAEDWPGLEAIRSLVQKANGLFIWAATALRFIHGGVDIDDRLRMLLKGERHERSPESHLDSIYITVLQTSVQGDLDPQEWKKHYEDLRTLLGSIVTLFSPLSLEALSTVLEFKKRYTNRMLRGLHAILDIPPKDSQLLRLHHPSFRDFLLSRYRCSDANFLVDEKLAHRHLASQCLKVMSSSLQQGACGVDAVGALVNENEGPRFKPCLPSELQYACQYWIQHLIRGNYELIDGGEVHMFLQEHCLYWLEALGWMGKVSEGIHAIKSLQSVILDCCKLHELLHDLKRFVLYNRVAIEQAPLQVYCSTLVFAPSGSIVKRQFAEKIPTWIKKLPQVDSSWSALLQTLEGHSDGARVIAFAPNNKVLASGSSDGTIKLWDVGTGALLQTLESFATDLIFSPDSKVLASTASSDMVKLWEVSTGELLPSLSRGHFSDMGFSPDSKMLLLSSSSEVELWNLSTGEKETRSNYPFLLTTAVTFSPEGTALALVSRLRSTTVLNVQTGEVIRHIEHDIRQTVSLLFESNVMRNYKRYRRPTAVLSPDGKTLALASRGTVSLWDVKTGAMLRIPEHRSKVTRLAFSPDGTILASSSFDMVLRLWQVGTAELMATLENFPDDRIPIFSTDNTVLAFISGDTVKLWKIKTGLMHSFKSHLGPGAPLAFSPDSKVLALGFGTGKIQLWDAVAGMVEQKNKDDLAEASEVAFSLNGKVLASISRDNTIKLWDMKSESEWEICLGSSGKAYKVALSPDGKMLASILAPTTRPYAESEASTINLWNVCKNEAPQRLKGHVSSILAITFSPDGTWLASASHDGEVKLWKVGTDEVLSLEYHHGVASTAVFSPNSKVLALALDTGDIELWDVDKCELTYMFNHDHVRAVAFSTESGVLASISYSERSDPKTPRDMVPYQEVVKLWDIGTGELLQILWSSRESRMTDFSLDGEALVLEPVNETVQMWDAKRWDANLGAVPKTDPPDALLSRLWSGGRLVFLQTYSGPTSTGFSFCHSSPKQKAPLKVYISEQWIFYRGLRVLWLPPEYRATCAAVHDGVVAIGRSSGAASLLEISGTS